MVLLKLFLYKAVSYKTRGLILCLKPTQRYKMFKKMSLVTALLVVSSAFSAHADDNTLAKSICSYTASNDKSDLRKALSDNRIRLKEVYSGVMCDGMNLVRFAISKNATETAEFIVKQIPASDLKTSGDLEWANQNGFTASKAVVALQTRIQG